MGYLLRKTEKKVFLLFAIPHNSPPAALPST